jgi:hypothetical protein
VKPAAGATPLPQRLLGPPHPLPPPPLILDASAWHGACSIRAHATSRLRLHPRAHPWPRR